MSLILYIITSLHHGLWISEVIWSTPYNIKPNISNTARTPMKDRFNTKAINL